MGTWRANGARGTGTFRASRSHHFAGRSALGKGIECCHDERILTGEKKKRNFQRFTHELHGIMTRAKYGSLMKYFWVIGLHFGTMVHGEKTQSPLYHRPGLRR